MNQEDSLKERRSGRAGGFGGGAGKRGDGSGGRCGGAVRVRQADQTGQH